ncbi:hypothetical protein R3P38DRAFT_2813685 [Favolaschia claudopus]|uniref:Uncharacterized protein n=1 Tax=Favolaschia claudopus TaxID=2862362 RepID=A0AAV9Z6G3_9AGAR
MSLGAVSSASATHPSPDPIFVGLESQIPSTATHTSAVTSPASSSPYPLRAHTPAAPALPIHVNADLSPPPSLIMPLSRRYFLHGTPNRDVDSKIHAAAGEEEDGEAADSETSTTPAWHANPKPEPDRRRGFEPSKPTSGGGGGGFTGEVYLTRSGLVGFLSPPPPPSTVRRKRAAVERVTESGNCVEFGEGDTGVGVKRDLLDDGFRAVAVIGRKRECERGGTRTL